MRQLSISEFSTLGWSFQQDVLRYAAQGIDAIGIWRDKIDDFGQQAAADLLFNSKMRVSSVHWAGGFTGSDGRAHDEAVDDAYHAIRLSSLLGAACLVVHPGSRNGHTTKHALRLFNNAMDSLVSVATDYGVRLAVEPMLSPKTKDWTFIHDFGQTLELISRYDAEQVGIVLDLFHVGSQAHVLNQLDQFVERIALVQLADRSGQAGAEESRCLLGTGVVPISRWLKRLDQIEYRGFLEVELFGFDVESFDHFELLDRTLDFFENASYGSRVAM